MPAEATMNQPDAPALTLAEGARLRSGTAARLAGVPVSTLRVWERRYGVVAAPKTATGQRLYTAHDVQRLRLLRQLTDRGHAIGMLAGLDLPTLQSLAQETPELPRDVSALRVLVVGAAAAQKLRAAPGWVVAEVFETLDALHARLPQPNVSEPPAPPLPAADLLLMHLPSLQPAVAERALALAAALPVRASFVVYGFGAEPVLELLRAAGVALRREPVSARELARLAAAAVRAGYAAPPVPALVADAPPPARRFDDELLARIAEMPSSVACECPRHVADIVMQLASFERYSADCLTRSPADAALHRHLSRLAGSARAMFEQALERVALQERMPLPPG
jgi:hypothetical protein